MTLRVGVVTVSSRCSQAQAEDTSGPELVKLIESRGWTVSTKTVIADITDDIVSTLRRLYAAGNCDVVLTTGGTGLSHDDVTPEATKKLLSRELPGISNAILIESLKETPFAMLSRGLAGVMGGDEKAARSMIIVNFPGSLKAVRTCFLTISPVLEHASSLVKPECIAVVRQVHGETSREPIGNSHHAEDLPCFHLQEQSRHHHHHHHHNHGPQQQLLTESRPRNRKSPYLMISVEEAQQIILKLSVEARAAHSVAMKSKILDLAKHCPTQLYSTAPIKALCAIPNFRASIKDGYAVRSCDGAGRRRVIGRSDAGGTGNVIEISEGECIIVNTGAMVPDSADAVVQIEDTKLLATRSGKVTNPDEIQIDSDDKDGNAVAIETEIEILKAPKLGQDIRPIGSDLSVGDLLINSGARFDEPALLGVLAAGGYSEITSLPPPKICIFSTGSELVDTTSTSYNDIPVGFVRDSNRPTLFALLSQQGYRIRHCLIDGGIVPDSELAVRDALRNAMLQHSANVIITTGGVSMGDRDYVKDVLVKHFNATIHFAQVAVRPGKPTVFATLKRPGTDHTVLVFGLPGNPVSALVTATLFVLPSLRCLSGCSPDAARPRTLFVQLAEDLPLDPRPHYHRVLVQSNPRNGVLLASSTTAGGGGDDCCHRTQLSSCLASALSRESSRNDFVGLVATPAASSEKFVAKAGTVLSCIPLTPMC